MGGCASAVKPQDNYQIRYLAEGEEPQVRLVLAVERCMDDAENEEHWKSLTQAFHAKFDAEWSRRVQHARTAEMAARLAVEARLCCPASVYVHVHVRVHVHA